MSKNLRKFENHSQYENYINGSSAILPNVSICTTEGDVHYNPLKCEESTTYELVGTPSYPSEVDGASASFNMTFNYRRTDINDKCSETVTEDSDTITVEIGTNPSTASSRTVDGTYDYHGLEIPYSVTQTKFEPPQVTAKFNVTSTSNPTRILSSSYRVDSVYIDSVKQSTVKTGYTFSTTGVHTVKYVLKDPTNIEENTFSGCSAMTSVVIPNSVTSIGISAFNRCKLLKSITIPDGVTNIGNNAFDNCIGLTSCTIPSGVTSIGVWTFNSCSGLTSIDIPDSVTSIGDYAFYHCYGLTSCTIGSGVTSIGNYVFEDCKSLTSIDIPDSVISIGDNAFVICTGLTNCTIGSGVTNIGAGAFSGCRSLTSVTIPSGVISIGNYAFNGCSGITSIVSNATTAPTIQNSTFQGVKTGGTLTVPSGSSGYDVWMGTGNYYLGSYNWTKVEQ